MVPAIYILCGITSCLCAALLIRQFRLTRARLLIWSSFAFIGMAVNNIMLFVDMIVFPYQIDLSVMRTVPAVIGVALSVYGLVKETV